MTAYDFEEVESVTIHEKLAQVHAAMRQPVKDSVNPHFNSTFASLNECNRVVSEAVREVGDCDYWQRAVFNPEAKCWEMQTVFAADGEEMILSTHPFRDDANPQKAASASTYARRYSMVSAFNLAAEDDDGNQASDPYPPNMASGENASKRRMWEAIKAYAQRYERDPHEVLAEVQAESVWNESADCYEMVAMKYEELAYG